MPRKASGWKLREPRDKCGNYTVYFTWNKKPIERSTGTSDPERAPIEAARIYAREISKPQQQPAKPVAPRSTNEFERAVTQWLNSLLPTHDAGTVKGYLGYADAHWFGFFKGLHHVTSDMCEQYMLHRLTKTLAATVKKELSALRGFVKWASDPKRGLIAPAIVPPVPARSTGKPYEVDGKPVRRRAPAIEMSATEVRALIKVLDEWSESKRVPAFPVKARFEFQYETGLRPEFIDVISVPEHYRRGATHLKIPAELDKGQFGRRVPLSKAARAAIDRVCPEEGVIFGHHDYRPRLRAAALDALPPDRAELFCGAHLRSARITHWLDKGAALTGVMRLVGHSRLETTAGYVRASEKAAEDIVAPKRRRR